MSTVDGLLGLLLILAGIVVVAMWIVTRRSSPAESRLLLVGLVTSVLGSMGYLYLIGGYYGGGDYMLYYREGVQYASVLLDGDWRQAAEAWSVQDGRWWGTLFTVHLSGLLFSLIGPNLPGAFLVFGLAGYAGVISLWMAARRSFPALDTDRYLAWLVLFPSLWFWPGSLGKDALVFFGIGVAVLGFVGRGDRTGWLPLVIGTALVFAVRPQVAATLVFALAASQWLSTFNLFTLGRGVQSALLLGAGIAVVTMASGALGVDLFEVDATTEYVEGRASVSQIGGSAIGSGGETASLWLAPINVLFRPFPWEASGPTGLLASFEMLVLWAAIWRRRRHIRGFARAYRHTRLFWVAIVFTLVYATALGLSIGNFGILARQRVHILPFLLLFVVGPREPGPMRHTAPQPMRRPVPA